MSSIPKIEDALREAILSRPDVILDDTDVMKALIGANDRSMGDNIVDLRGIAMERMETQLDRLENTHRSVIAAAYENLAGTQQIHRAILRLMEPLSFAAFLNDLGTEVADTLRVDSIKLVLETDEDGTDLALDRTPDVLGVAQPGYVAGYLAQNHQSSAHVVVLGAVQNGTPFVHGDKADQIRSEACLILDFGPDRLPGLLIMGSLDPHMFAPQQGTDLLVFFAGAFERLMRRWLA